GSANKLAKITTDTNECDQSSKKLNGWAGSTPRRASKIHTTSGRNAPIRRAHRGARGSLALIASAAAKCGAYTSPPKFGSLNQPQYESGNDEEQKLYNCILRTHRRSPNNKPARSPRLPRAPSHVVILLEFPRFSTVMR